MWKLKVQFFVILRLRRNMQKDVFKGFIIQIADFNEVCSTVFVPNYPLYLKLHVNLIFFSNPLHFALSLITPTWTDKKQSQIITNESKYHGILTSTKKQPSRGVLRKKCSKNMQQIYRGTPMPKCNFNGCSPVNLMHIFRTPFLRTPLEGCFWSNRD